jgi:hypothetical protein
MTRHIFDEATQYVSNKSILSKIRHAPVFHSIRSAGSSGGSLAAKSFRLAAKLGAATAKQIPLPILKDVVANVITLTVSSIQKRRYASKLASASSYDEAAKFGVKGLSIEDLDRMRWKLDAAHKEFIKAFGDLPQTMTGEEIHCQAFFEAAVGICQFQRRISRLEVALNPVVQVSSMLLAWSYALEHGIDASDVTIGSLSATSTAADRDHSISKTTAKLIVDINNYAQLVADAIIGELGPSATPSPSTTQASPAAGHTAFHTATPTPVFGGISSFAAQFTPSNRTTTVESHKFVSFNAAIHSSEIANRHKSTCTGPWCIMKMMDTTAVINVNDVNESRPHGIFSRLIEPIELKDLGEVGYEGLKTLNESIDLGELIKRGVTLIHDAAHR